MKNVLLLRIMKAKNIFYLIAVLLLGKSLYGQVQPTWESINERGYPQWFSDAKLGIFIHWGVYSVPAYASLEGYAEWYYRGLMTNDDRKALQERIYGKDFQYEDFAPMWKAELWNPDEIGSKVCIAGLETPRWFLPLAEPICTRMEFC